MRTFVTGATGFVGSHLAELLLSRGDEVVALARRTDAADELRRAGMTAVVGTLEDEAALGAALAGAEIVYHVAGLTSGTSQELRAVNEAGTARLLAVAGRAGSVHRFVHVSSQAALGPSAPGIPLTEDAPCSPVTAYGRSKLAGERLVAASQLPWTIVRPPSVYGPRDREFLQLFKAVRTGLAPVFGDGSQELSLIYVADLVQFIAAAGVAPEGTGQILHAAHAEVVRSRDLARAAGTAQGKRTVVIPMPGVVAKPVVTLFGRAMKAAGRRTVLTADKLAELMAPSWLLSSVKAEQLMGWRAPTTMAVGIPHTAAWYREAGWL